MGDYPVYIHTCKPSPPPLATAGALEHSNGTIPSLHEDEDVATMNDHTILETVQQWRRKKYSARPFALTILAISLITLLAIAKDYRSHVGVRSAGALRKRDLVIAQDEEVCQP